MKETSKKTQLYKLCRDINNGYFSPDVSDDIISMYELFLECKETSAGKDISKQTKKEAIKQIYYALLKLNDYELKDEEYITAIKYILGIFDSPTPHGGFALWAKYCGELFISRDMLSLASDFISQLPAEYKDDIIKYTNIRKKLIGKILFGFVGKNSL